MNHELRVSHLAWPVSALGPGKRAALWLAGCPLRCHDCITPELQPEDSGHVVSHATALARLLSLPEELDGLTLSGGEPFFQATAVTSLLQALKHRRPRWNILVFSGYTLTHLRADEASRKLLEQIDLLVDGAFLPARMSGHHPLLASANQQLHALSPRGEQLLDSCAGLPPDSADMGISNQGNKDWLIGILGQKTRQQLHQRLGCD